MSSNTPPARRFLDRLDALRAMPVEFTPDELVEFASQEASVALIDLTPGDSDDLHAALREWLAWTRPPGGAHGQAMEATMAYSATSKLRAVAARVLREAPGE